MVTSRKILRDKGIYNRRPQYTEFDEEGGYITLHPTKGWKRVSAGRIRARQRMLGLFQ